MQEKERKMCLVWQDRVANIRSSFSAADNDFRDRETKVGEMKFGSDCRGKLNMTHFLKWEQRPTFYIWGCFALSRPPFHWRFAHRSLHCCCCCTFIIHTQYGGHVRSTNCSVGGWDCKSSLHFAHQSVDLIHWSIHWKIGQILCTSNTENFTSCWTVHGKSRSRSRGTHRIPEWKAAFWPEASFWENGWVGEKWGVFLGVSTEEPKKTRKILCPTLFSRRVILDLSSRKILIDFHTHTFTTSLVGIGMATDFLLSNFPTV